MSDLPEIEFDLCDELSNWAKKFGIKHVALKELLLLLKNVDHLYHQIQGPY